jgi:hypothetical protein
MIEVPRGALTADEIAGDAQFFSFGTNDLTQMAFGFSRDDVGKFLRVYQEKKILEKDPFATFDAAGTGQLVAMAVEKGRKARPDLKLGICGEHGGDPASVHFFHQVGLDYVSCSPYRVPVARLAAAQAALSVKVGFTLLELLVSITLMGFLAVAIHMGFRIGANAWAKGDSRLETIRVSQFSLDLLSRQISSMVPYYSQQKINDAPVDILLFQGVPKAMRFVTSFSAQSRSAGGLRLVEYFVSNSKNKGTSALLINERPLPGDPALSGLVFRDISRGDNNTLVVNFFEFRARSDSLYLFEGVDQAQFQYLRPRLPNSEGPDDKKEHLPLGVEIQLRWKEPGIFSAREFSVVVPTHAIS